MKKRSCRKQCEQRPFFWIVPRTENRRSPSNLGKYRGWKNFSSACFISYSPQTSPW